MAPEPAKTQEDLRRRAEALAQEGEAAVPKLVEMLGSLVATMGRVAAEALVRIGRPAVPALIEMLGERAFVPRYPMMSSTALDMLGYDVTQDDVTSPAAERAAGVLVRMGAAVVPDLVEALADADGQVRDLAQRALIRIGKDAAPGLVARLSDPRAGARAASALAAIGPASAPALLSVLAGPDPVSSVAACQVLGRMVDEAARAEAGGAEDLLEAPPASPSEVPAESLADHLRSADWTVGRALRGLLRRGSDEERAAARKVLGMVGGQGVPARRARGQDPL